MSESGKAVFLSYASQDKEVAKRICDALRAAGIEVWFDLSELRGGDAWDQKIRKQIKECALFMPVITPNTNSRPEGYFRLEWKLAVDRSHLLADDHPFLFPIAVGDINDATARVPDKFREVQWTKLRLDETPAELASRVTRLLGEGLSAKGEGRKAEDRRPETKEASLTRKLWKWIVLVMVAYYSLRGVVKDIIRDFRGESAKPAAVAPAAPDPGAQAPDTKPQSEARQLSDRAKALLDAVDSTPADFAAAEALLKRALELDATDGEIWAVSARLNSAFSTRGFDRSPSRREAARSQAERAVKLAPDSAEAWHALGRGVWNSDSARAEEAIRHALKLAPTDGRLLLSLGSILRNQDKSEEALAVYEQAAAQPESRSLARYDQFLIHFYRRRFAEADRCVREALAVQPTVNNLSGVAMSEITWHGEVAAALQRLTEAPAKFRGEPRMVITTALVALMARQPEKSLQALERFPGDYISDAWYTGPKGLLVGLAHREAGRPEAARVAWESALLVVRHRLQEAPNDAEQRLRLGELLAWTGQTEDALREVRVLNELVRGRMTDWTYSTVRIHAALGRADDAVPMLEKLIAGDAIIGRWPLTPALLRLDPLWDKLRDDPRFQKLCEEPVEAAAPNAATPLSPARELVAKARELLSKLDNTREDALLAEEYCQRALKLDPTDADVWAEASHVNSAFGYRGWDTSPERREQIRLTAERAIRLNPKSVEARIAQAGAWSTFGINRTETEKLLREVVQEQPDNQAALRFLAVTVLGQGKLDECLALNERSAALPDGDPLALLNNARYLLQRGRTTEADETLARALAQKPFSSAYILKAQMEVIRRGDLDAADAALAQVPQAFLLDDRPNIVAGFQKFYRGDGPGALAVWGSFPRDYYADFTFDGPKGLLMGLAYELDHREAAAKLEWQAALQLVEKRLTATPNNASLHYHRAYLLACLGDKAGAEAALRTQEQLLGFKWGADGSRDWTQAVIYARLGRFDPIFEHLVDQNRNLPRIRLDPRFAALRADPRYAAVAAKPKAATPPAARDWPKNPELKKAVALLDRFDCIPEDLRLAEEIAQHVLDQAPTDPETVTAMARVQATWLVRGWDRSSERYLKAQRIAERAVQLAPDEPEALGALASYLNQRGNNVARARQLLDRAIELAPHESRFHRWRNELVWGDRSVPDAVALAAVERTLAQFPNDALVHYDASRHYRFRGRLEDSLREIDATLAIAPVANALVWKARILFGFNNDLPAMKAALDLVPERVRSIERTVFGYFVYAVMSGDYAVGVKALNDMPDRWMIDFDYRGPKALLLASLLEQQHKPALARIQYEIALKELKERQAAEPDDAWLKMDEAWVLHGLGRGEEARAAVQVYNESLDRPYRMARVGSWWFYPIACNLIVGERATALALIREAAETKDGRETVRRFLASDPRLVAFRDDAEIKALLGAKP